MNEPKPLPIFEAIKEVSKRRDNGEEVRAIMPDVAESYRVPLQALVERAEDRWGRPLETDRLRNREYHQYMASKKQIIDLAKSAASSGFLDYIRRDEVPRWDYGFELWVESLKINDISLKIFAERAYFNEVSRLNLLRRCGQI